MSAAAVAATRTAAPPLSVRRNASSGLLNRRARTVVSDQKSARGILTGSLNARGPVSTARRDRRIGADDAWSRAIDTRWASGHHGIVRGRPKCGRALVAAKR